MENQENIQNEEFVEIEKPKIEKIKLSELKQEKEKIIQDENRQAFQKEVNLLFADLVKKIEAHSDEEIQEFFDFIDNQ